MTIFFLTSALLVVSCLVAFTIIASHLSVKPPHLFASNTFTVRSDIMFALEIISADPIARTIEIDWYPEITTPCSAMPTLVADIYVDAEFLDTTSPSFSPQTPLLPAYQINSSAYCVSGTPWTPVFRTVSKLRSVEADALSPIAVSSSSLQNYPFDVYFAPQHIRAINHETSAMVPVNVTRYFGVAVNFQLTIRSTYYGDTPHNEVFISLKIERSRATKVFVVIIAMTNWLIAIAFLTICVATQIYDSPTIYSEMFVIPVGAVLSLTSVRANLPGAPVGFGATIDSYSVLPVLVIMAICSFYLLVIILYRRLTSWEKQADVIKRSEEASVALESQNNISSYSAVSSETQSLAFNPISAPDKNQKEVHGAWFAPFPAHNRSFWCLPSSGIVVPGY
ncbi:hypothetical protein BDQ12DRAFT_766759 [Crucibulum laeve]|uniref:Transmembrane protein n=1 Tax=Crucibulum laeve TaxID=68775 RepID=A0A5C3LKZ9_9AGAR|nr:hypothetical protein BDQ12DRAFT_766759 [Crucibulum laeve]